MEDAYDPSLPLETEEAGSISHGTRCFRRIRFTGSRWKGEPQRVAALLGLPEGAGPFPAVIQIHGGGQNPLAENVALFVEAGFACLALDWQGPLPGGSPEDATEWHPDILNNRFGRSVADLDAVVYRHAVAAARRAIDVLAEDPRIDAARVGMQGVSWGGLIAWLVNGVEPRLKAVVPVYGAGGIASQWSDNGSLMASLEAEHRQGWAARYDPASHASTQEAPVFHINSTNDFFGQLPDAEKLLEAVSAPVWRAYSPNRMHSLDRSNVHAAMAWLKCILYNGDPPPPPPQVEIMAGGDGMVRVGITTAREPGADGVQVHFARGSLHPVLRCWLTREATRTGAARWEAEIPVAEELHVYASAHHREFGTVSSAIVGDTLGARLATPPPTDILSDWGAPDGGWWLHHGVDFFCSLQAEGRLEQGIAGARECLLVKGVRPVASTRVLTDPHRSRGETRSLEIWLHDVERLRLRTNWFLFAPGYTEHQAESASGRGWHLLRVAPSDFTSTEADGQSLSDWNDVASLTLELEPLPGGTPAIGRLSWA